jgi:F0F1-type ATP synthase membrane subunit b/b'
MEHAGSDMSPAFHFILYIVGEEGSTPWWNYPGFELWKFLNLAVFLLAAWYLHRILGRPISEALRTRKETIKRELARAREERDSALRQLEQVEARLQGLQNDVAAIRQKARSEAQAESERMRAQTEAELNRLRLNAQREIEMAGKIAVTELRKFASELSIERAEELIRREIREEDEIRLVRAGTRNLGGPEF